jgi:hypothetical protein
MRLSARQGRAFAVVVLVVALTGVLLGYWVFVALT